jgi:hypothetical protein
MGQSQSIERPTPVTAIAVLQFSKAWALMLVAVIAWLVPQALQYYGDMVSSVVYFASHGKNARGPLLPLIAVYVAVMGWGLWSLKGWARKSLMATSGLTIAVWVRGFLFAQAMGVTSLSPSQMQVVGFLLLVDAITFFYLFFGVDVKLAFGVKD